MKGVYKGFVAEHLSKLRRKQVPKIETSFAVADSRLPAILNRLVGCFFALDRHWRVTAFNEAAEAHFGLNKADVLGRSIWTLVPHARGSEFERRFREVLATTQPVRFETASVVRPASVVDFSVFPLDDGLGVSFRNITDQRRAEAALHESETRLEIATAAANLGVWDWNIVTGKMLYSDRARAIYGFQRGEVTFEQVRAATHPDDIDRTSAMAARALDPAIREEVPYEFRIIRASDGEVRWILAHGRAVFTTGGGEERPLNYIGTIQDITDRKRSDEALRESEARLRLAVDAGRMAVWVYDVRTQTVLRSPELNRVLGFPPDAQPTLTEFHEGYLPGEQERVRAAGQRALAEAERFFEVEYRYRRPDRDVRWLLLRAEINLDEKTAQPANVVGVLLDVTDRKAAEERQQLLIHELNHRVKNTIATVQAIAAQSFRSGETLESANANFAARLSTLSKAHDVLTRGNWEGASLSEIVSNVSDLHGDRVRISGPPVRLNSSSALAVSMALHELGTNAIKYGSLSNETGYVEMVWTTEDGVLRFRWQEHGGPTVSPPTRAGFGSRLIGRSLQAELGGGVRLLFEPTGVVCSFELQLATSQAVIELQG